jgi:hypothetical protein
MIARHRRSKTLRHPRKILLDEYLSAASSSQFVRLTKLVRLPAPIVPGSRCESATLRRLASDAKVEVPFWSV